MTNEEFNQQYLTQPEKDPADGAPDLKRHALHLLREAERKMHEYACSCEVGEERTRAFDIYENIRTATRVG